MRSHRVWSAVDADNYKTSKSFGGEFRQQINVGSSASYSEELCTISVRELNDTTNDDESVFVLFVDGAPIKKMRFNNKTREFTPVASAVFE